jgi:hypothetical protein
MIDALGLFDQIGNEVGVSNIIFIELVRTITLVGAFAADFDGVILDSCIVEGVEIVQDDNIVTIYNKTFRKMAADESGIASDAYSH